MESLHFVELGLDYVFHVKVLQGDVLVSLQFGLFIQVAPCELKHLFESKECQWILFSRLVHFSEQLVNKYGLSVIVGLLS